MSSRCDIIETCAYSTGYVRVFSVAGLQARTENKPVVPHGKCPGTEEYEVITNMNK